MGGSLDDPDAPDLPSSADWNIARSLGEWGISFDTIQLAFIRRMRSTSDTYLPPIRSLAYFRAVALNLSPQERDPAYFDYVWSLYEQLRAPHPEASADTSASACATIRVQSVGDALRLLVVYAEIT